MKHVNNWLLLATVLLYSCLAFAQHGNAGGAGAGGGMGHSMGRTTTNRGSMRPSNPKGSNPDSSHRMSVSDLLSKNTKLADKLQTLTGMPAQQACDGFRNLGQCVAAAHVSKNLDISFACLKSDMTGQAPAQGTSCPQGTGAKSMSLGKSIQTLKPAADSNAEAKKAQKQASQDIKNSKS